LRSQRRLPKSIVPADIQKPLRCQTALRLSIRPLVLPPLPAEFALGATPVRIVGKTLQEDMHEFYARHDVLLAPSLWPEPFGLVTREALSAGLWVLASDRGAIGEDVIPGLNGWIVDVTTPKAMLAVLAEIDSNPAKYLQSPAAAPLRTANDQAAELFKIYIDVLSRQRAPIQPYVRRTVEEDIGRPRTTISLNPKTSRSASDLQT
jgi:glycosyltransferase involved in cell wall biosynthesis